MVCELFEKYQAPALHVTIPGVLSLHAAGRRTGVVVDSGHGVSYTLPVYEGFVVPHAVRRLDLGGKDLTEYLAQLLAARRGFGFKPQRDVAGLVKEQCCFVAEDFSSVAEAEIMNFKLPDGNIL